MSSLQKAMVGGKVKTAMGLQRSPSTAKLNAEMGSPKQPASVKSKSEKKGSGGGAAFSRPFGVHFPRSLSQVQPRPPDNVAELMRVVEELRERESRLKTELLEQKLLKESAAIVPALEIEISNKESEIAKNKKKLECLEAENERLRQENEFLHMELSKLNLKYQERIRCMQSELSDIKRAVAEREQEREEEASSSSTTQINKSSFSAAKCSRKFLTQNTSSVNPPENRNCTVENEAEVRKEDHNVPSEIPESLMEMKSRTPRVPRPPPRPSASSISSFCSSSSSSSSLLSSLSSSPDSTNRPLSEISNIPPPPVPPPPPPPSAKSSAPPPPPPPPATAAPPPPPPPLKGPIQNQAKVRRVPEVVEFYHSLMKRDSSFRRDNGGSATASDAPPPGAVAKDMIGEIENRSSYLQAIKSDVEIQGEFIKFLIKEVEKATFSDIEDVVPFVKWLDDELSFLVDERAVLKHFDWPEQKADALREAAFGYCDLKKLESEVRLFHDDSRQPCVQALKKMQSLFEKLEHGVYNLSRMRESASRRYQMFGIPMNWMQETGYVSQIKLASVKLAMKYVKRVSVELGLVGASGLEEEELIVQAVKFAFRVHQFAGGFDVETMKAFQELKDKAQYFQIHQHQQQKSSVARSSACAY